MWINVAIGMKNCEDRINRMFSNNLERNKEKSANNRFITIQPRIIRHERVWDVEGTGNPGLNNSTWNQGKFIT